MTVEGLKAPLERAGLEIAQPCWTEGPLPPRAAWGRIAAAGTAPAVILRAAQLDAGPTRARLGVGGRAGRTAGRTAAVRRHGGRRRHRARGDRQWGRGPDHGRGPDRRADRGRGAGGRPGYSARAGPGLGVAVRTAVGSAAHALGQRTQRQPGRPGRRTGGSAGRVEISAVPGPVDGGCGGGHDAHRLADARDTGRVPAEPHAGAAGPSDPRRAGARAPGGARPDRLAAAHGTARRHLRAARGRPLRLPRGCSCRCGAGGPGA